MLSKRNLVILVEESVTDSWLPLFENNQNISYCNQIKIIDVKPQIPELK